MGTDCAKQSGRFPAKGAEMNIKTVLISLFAVAFATGVLAQNKISGTQQCKATPPTPVAIGDRPNHALAIVTAQCTWSKPIEMAGLQAKDGVDTVATEISGDVASDRGYYVGTVSNGDKFTVKFSGTSRSKDGKPVSSEGTWHFTDGAGKLKGLKGKGTFKGTPNADGTMSYQIEGEYSLP